MMTLEELNKLVAEMEEKYGPFPPIKEEPEKGASWWALERVIRRLDLRGDYERAKRASRPTPTLRGGE